MAAELVIFDLGGVVVHSESDRLIHQVAQLLGRDFDDVQQAVYDRELLEPFEVGAITPQAYYEGLRSSLGLSWVYDQFVQAWNGILSENSEVAALVRRLKPSHRLAALTNTNTLHLDYIKSACPVMALFERVVASCESGCRKPQPEIYRLVLERAGVAPRDAVFIDDRPEFVEAGLAVGLRAIRFERVGQLEEALRGEGLDV